MSRNQYRTIGFASVGIGLALGVSWLLWQAPMTAWLARFASRDGSITPAGSERLLLAVYTAVALMWAVGIVIVKAGDVGWRRRLSDALLIDPGFAHTRGFSLPRQMLIASTVVGVVLLLAILLAYRLFGASSEAFRVLYLEDGVLESATPLLFVLSSLMLGRVAVGLLRIPKGETAYRIAAAALAFMAVMAFLYAMEEISWGQRIFGWETPEVIAEGNTQDETNIHNYFTASFDIFYRLLVFFPVTALVPLWLEVSHRSSTLSRLVLPHPSMLGLALLTGFVALIWYQEQELLEEMIAVFVFFYGLRLHFWARSRPSVQLCGQGPNSSTSGIR